MKKIWKALLPILLLALLLYLRLPAQTAEGPAGSQPQAQDTEVLTLAPESEPEAPAPEQPAAPEEAAPPETETAIAEDGEYNSKDEVALYIHLFGHLPKNYITKSKAQDLGWTGGSLEPYAPGCSIGGGYFGNY